MRNGKMVAAPLPSPSFINIFLSRALCCTHAASAAGSATDDKLAHVRASAHGHISDRFAPTRAPRGGRRVWPTARSRRVGRCAPRRATIANPSKIHLGDASVIPASPRASREVPARFPCVFYHVRHGPRRLRSLRPPWRYGRIRFRYASGLGNLFLSVLGVYAERRNF